MQENLEAEENDYYDVEMEKDQAQFEQEMEAEANRVTPAEAIQMFAAPEDEGGFGDLWGHEPTRQKIIDAVDLEIAAGADNSDYRVYEKVGNQFRKRQRQLKNGEVNENQINREDVMNQLSAQRHREMIIGNEYAAPPEQPETPEQIRQRFAIENPDITRDEFLDAAQKVDQTHKRQYIQRGFSSNEYQIYKEAAEKAEKERYLRERQGE